MFVRSKAPSEPNLNCNTRSTQMRGYEAICQEQRKETEAEATDPSNELRENPNPYWPKEH